LRLLQYYQVCNQGGREMALVESILLKKKSYYNSNWLTQAKSKTNFFSDNCFLGGAPIKTKTVSIPTTTLKVGSSCLHL